MEWWVRVVSPVRRVWIRIAARLRIQRSGLRVLRNEVSTCEYEDVHVMWEMLRKADAEIGPLMMKRKRKRKRRGHMRSVFDSLCCAF